jgi:uncharacterized protein YdcH (DUF465 family)
MHSPHRARFFSQSVEPDSAWHLDKENPVENHTQDEDLKAHLLQTNDEFRSLAEQHARYKKQIEEIEAKAHVTEADELEEQRIKKLKLRTKDQMNEIVAQYRHSAVS